MTPLLSLVDVNDMTRQVPVGGGRGNGVMTPKPTWYADNHDAVAATRRLGLEWRQTRGRNLPTVNIRGWWR